jgi:two-component system, cell cycle sensor histidine kinase and response regulator CckA
LNGARQMLAYAGRAPVKLEERDLSTVVAATAELLRAVVSKKVELGLHLAAPMPALNGDGTQIRQVVMNLITNASDALADESGHVDLRTGTRELDAEEIAHLAVHDCMSPGRHVFVEVSDDGCGMEEGTCSRIFDPFFTTKFAGRGLGLASVLGIVRGHRGGIRVDSAPGRGTVFTVFLPTAARAALPPPPVAAATPEPWRASGQVLVVDDEPLVRGVTARILHTMGFDVLTAGDGVEALRIFRESQDRIATVVLDVTMPRMSGQEVLSELHRMNPDLPVILCSGFSEADIDAHAANGARVSFLEKPFREDDLVAKLRDVLRTDRA